MHLDRRCAAIERAAHATVLAVVLWAAMAPSAHAADGYAEDAAAGCIVFKPNLKPGEAVAWKGACVKGQASGPGVASWTASDGSTLTFEGTFALGKLQGEGRMTASGGDRYVGSYNDGKRDGRGSYVAANGDRYEGDYRANQRNGHGVLTLASGQRLEGQWKDGTQVAATNLSPQAPPNQTAVLPASSLSTARPELPGVVPPPDPAARTLVAAEPGAQRPQSVQQRAVERQQQQLAAQQAAQEQQAQRQRDYEEQQRVARENRQAALTRQRWADFGILALFLLVPVGFAGLVYQMKWQRAVSQTEVLGATIERARSKLAGNTGYFARFVRAPIVWSFAKLYSLTGQIGDQFLRSGARIAGSVYLVYGVVLTAYAAFMAAAFAVGVVIALALLYLLLKFLPAILAMCGIHVPNFGRFMPIPSRSSDAATSREREGLFGAYTETRDASGNVIAESRQRDGVFGSYTETRDANGNVIAESREREGLLGPYTETRDANGKVIAETRQREGLLGTYAETRDADGKVVSEFREREGLLGNYTEHKRV